METLIHPRGRQIPELALGRYRLLGQLGAGGFGVVWHAHDERLDREVAVKRIPLPSEEHSQRATREALVSARLSHPAIVTLYEACAQDEEFYLVSELVRGPTLAELIAEDALDDEQIADVGIAVAHALAHAHARGVIHRDVKPQNVIVPSESSERTAAAKLADFGGARLTGEDALTRSGDVLGTLAYMAPEQCEGGEAGPEADVYSLALVIYEAFSGVNPVRGATPAATARRIGQWIEPLERRRRRLPRDLTRTIDASLDPDPRRRATLGELTEALEAAMESGLRRKEAVRGRMSGARPPGAQPWAPLGQAPLGRPPEALESIRASSEEPSRPRRFGLLSSARLAALVALVGWQALSGRPGLALLLAAAGMPLLAWRRSSLGWLLAAFAPALGMLGLAAAYPALAGQLRRVWQRAAAAALGLWWLALSEAPLHRRLWEGPPRGLPARMTWEGSLQGAAAHALGGALTSSLLIYVLVWAAAAALLPWLVRGRSAALDVAAALTWTVALIGVGSLLQRSMLGNAAAQSAPRGLLLGAVLGCMLAVCARALRGPVCP